MEKWPVFDAISIQSHKGPYLVNFGEKPLLENTHLFSGTQHFLVDSFVAQIHQEKLGRILTNSNTILIEAHEERKSLEMLAPVIERLVVNGVRREHCLVAIGGGVIQDITCFIASTLLRGVRWRFIPTTLLAQADSCIGSKSSINLGAVKNILGTFCPPELIHIDTSFLKTLKKS
jgi:3-dehydroquinate synthase